MYYKKFNWCRSICNNINKVCGSNSIDCRPYETTRTTEIKIQKNIELEQVLIKRINTHIKLIFGLPD